MNAQPRPITTGFRRAMLAKVHLAAKELGLDEDARRDVLERVTGRRSSADCDHAQLEAVIREFKRLGWGAAPSKKAAPTPLELKARAMWASLWHLGVVNNAGQPALEAFAKRQLRVDRMRWADPGTAYKLIEALKAIAERNGWSQDLAGLKPERQVWSLKARLVQRQAEILGVKPFQIAGFTEKQLDALAAANGVEIRKVAGA
jgi:phage gp16-like protein